MGRKNRAGRGGKERKIWIEREVRRRRKRGRERRLRERRRRDREVRRKGR